MLLYFTQDAGVPPLFCGCNLLPCENNMKSVIKARYAEIAAYMNNKVFPASPSAHSVCIPLTANDFMMVPGNEGSDCMLSQEEVGVVIVSLWIPLLFYLSQLLLTFSECTLCDFGVMYCMMIITLPIHL